ncbi:uracil-DNA glycosylase family protein [Streptomyces sp. NPDC088254]|uniref:uracil-DNA glycosylase family protein n=1 Tax=Streptomyces sp. NPDC088254 TaxID=3365847 RepID=UPI00381D520D
MAGTKAAEDAYTAAPFVPRTPTDLAPLREAAAHCRGCVGPVGELLDRALADAGLDPAGAYVTNAVEHFKFTPAEPRKRRIHKAPTLREAAACVPWPAAELAIVEPELIVVPGATAGKALLGSSFKVTEARGTLLEREIHGRPERLLPTVHPSSVLRADDREAAYRGLAADLRTAARALS